MRQERKCLCWSDAAIWRGLSLSLSLSNWVFFFCCCVVLHGGCSSQSLKQMVGYKKNSHMSANRKGAQFVPCSFGQRKITSAFGGKLVQLRALNRDSISHVSMARMPSQSGNKTMEEVVFYLHILSLFSEIKEGLTMYNPTFLLCTGY